MPNSIVLHKYLGTYYIVGAHPTKQSGASDQTDHIPPPSMISRFNQGCTAIYLSLYFKYPRLQSKVCMECNTKFNPVYPWLDLSFIFFFLCKKIILNDHLANKIRKSIYVEYFTIQSWLQFIYTLDCEFVTSLFLCSLTNCIVQYWFIKDFIKNL